MVCLIRSFCSLILCPYMKMIIPYLSSLWLCSSSIHITVKYRISVFSYQLLPKMIFIYLICLYFFSGGSSQSNGWRGGPFWLFLANWASSSMQGSEDAVLLRPCGLRHSPGHAGSAYGTSRVNSVLLGNHMLRTESGSTVDKTHTLTPVTVFLVPNYIYVKA